MCQYSAQNNPLVYAVKCTIVVTAEHWVSSSPGRQEPFQAEAAFAAAVGTGKVGAAGAAPGILGWPSGKKTWNILPKLYFILI